MPRTRYIIGREYTPVQADADVDLTGITPQAALMAVGSVPADWVDVAAEDMATATGSVDSKLLMPLIGGTAHGTVDTLIIDTTGDFQLWLRYTVGDEIIPRPVELVTVA